MEKKGWVEVIIGEEVYKQRLGKLVVVPSTYSNGDVIDENITIATNDKSSQHPSKKDKSKCSPSSSPEKKSQIPISSLYYWFCEPCKMHNVFNERLCRNCNTVTKGGRDSTLSALLQLVEKVCEGANDDDQDLSCYIPEIHLPSVPKDVVDAVRALKKNRETKFDSSSVTLSLEKLFFWRCNYCTMDNSFKVWSCKTCKKKVRKSVPLLIFDRLVHLTSSRLARKPMIVPCPSCWKLHQLQRKISFIIKMRWKAFQVSIRLQYPKL